MEPILKAYINEAIEIEKAGLKVNFETKSETIPEEFQRKLDEIPALKTAYEALTPKRKREYILYFLHPNNPKPGKTGLRNVYSKFSMAKDLMIKSI